MAGRKKRAGPINYFELSRKQLQTLCKKHGFPANKTNVLMAEFLTAHLESEGHIKGTSPSNEDEKSDCLSRDNEMLGSEITADDSQLDASECQAMDLREQASYSSATSILNSGVQKDQTTSNSRMADAKDIGERDHKVDRDDKPDTPLKTCNAKLPSGIFVPEHQHELNDGASVASPAVPEIGIDLHSQTGTSKDNTIVSGKNDCSQQKVLGSPVPVSIMPYACLPTPPQPCTSGNQDFVRQPGAANVNFSCLHSRPERPCSLVQHSSSISKDGTEHNPSSEHEKERSGELGVNPGVDRSWTAGLSEEAGLESVSAGAKESNVSFREPVSDQVQAVLRTGSPLNHISTPLKVTIAVATADIISGVNNDPGRSKIVEEWSVDKIQPTALISLDENSPVAQRSLERSSNEHLTAEVEAEPLKEIVDNTVRTIDGGGQSKQLYSISRKDSYKSSALTRASRIAAELERASKKGQVRRLEVLASKRALGVGKSLTNTGDEDMEDYYSDRAMIEPFSAESSIDVVLKPSFIPMVELLGNCSPDNENPCPPSKSGSEGGDMDYILSQEATEEASAPISLNDNDQISLDTIMSGEKAMEVMQVSMHADPGAIDEVVDIVAAAGPTSGLSSETGLDPVFSSLADVVEIPKGVDEVDMRGLDYTSVVAPAFEPEKASGRVVVGSEAAVQTLADTEKFGSISGGDVVDLFGPAFASENTIEFSSATDSEPHAANPKFTTKSTDKFVESRQPQVMPPINLSTDSKSVFGSDGGMSEGETHDTILAQRNCEEFSSRPSWMTAPIVVPAKKVVNRKAKEKFGNPFLLSAGKTAKLMEQATEMPKRDVTGVDTMNSSPNDRTTVAVADYTGQSNFTWRDQLEILRDRGSGAAASPAFATKHQVEDYIAPLTNVSNTSGTEPTSGTSIHDAHMAFALPPPSTRHDMEVGMTDRGEKVDGSTFKEGRTDILSKNALSARSFETKRTDSRRNSEGRKVEMIQSRKILSFLDIDFTKPSSTSEKATAEKPPVLSMIDTNRGGGDTITERSPNLIKTPSMSPANLVVQDALRDFEEVESNPGDTPVCCNENERSVRQDQHKTPLTGKSKQKALRIAEKNASSLREHILKQRRGMDQRYENSNALLSLQSTASPFKPVAGKRLL